MGDENIRLAAGVLVAVREVHSDTRDTLFSAPPYDLLTHFWSSDDDNCIYDLRYCLQVREASLSFDYRGMRMNGKNSVTCDLRH